MGENREGRAGQQPNQNLPPMDPRLLAAMYGVQTGDEIDLLGYWWVVWAQRKFILSITFAAALLAAGVSLLMPNIYRAEALLAPVKTEDNKGGGLASTLGGLASMAGISIASGGSVEENLAVLKSREFLWKFINEKKLMQTLFEDDWNADKGSWEESEPEDQPSLWDAYRLFTEEDLLSVSTDKESGLVHVRVEWTDAQQAADWANALVTRLNAYLRQQAIARSNSNLKYLYSELERTSVADMRQALFELISQEQKKAMLANTQEQFAFQVLDAAVAPDRKAKPGRSLIVLLAVFATGFVSVVGVLIAEGVRARRAGQEE